MEDKIQTQAVETSFDSYLDDMTLFDDALMSKVFDGNIEATELLLRIVLEREDIKVLSVIGQREMKNPIVGGRDIRLDVLAQDSTGRYFDIEVQKENKGAHFKRVRFYNDMVGSRMLKAGQDFDELMDSYVIFITKHDIIGEGIPLYHVKKTFEETDKIYDDGSHIIFVNGSYKGNDPVGKLMHDFNEKKPSEMFYDPLAKGVKHFKETEGGRKEMNKSLEQYMEELTQKKVQEKLQETLDESHKDVALQMLKMGKFALEDIASISKLSLSQVQELSNGNAD